MSTQNQQDNFEIYDISQDCVVVNITLKQIWASTQRNKYCITCELICGHVTQHVQEAVSCFHCGFTQPHAPATWCHWLVVSQLFKRNNIKILVEGKQNILIVVSSWPCTRLLDVEVFQIAINGSVRATISQNNVIVIVMSGRNIVEQSF